MKYLKKEEILYLNQQLVLTFGGFFDPSNNNLLHPEKLEYLIGVVEAKSFGKKFFWTKFEIASAYIFYIINDHIFLDGNKRTGLNAALLFLARNKININTTNSEIETFALRVVENKLSKKEIVQWLKSKKANLDNA